MARARLALLAALAPLLGAGGQLSPLEAIGASAWLFGPAHTLPAAAAEEGSGPRLATAWKAEYVVEGGNSPQRGTYFYDRTHRRMRQSYQQHQALFTPDDVFHFDMVSTSATGLNYNITVGQGADSVCKASSISYGDPFALLAQAQRNGSGIVGGEPCDVWAAEVASPVTGTMAMSACIAADGVPREVNQSGGLGFHTQLSRMRLGNISVGPLEDSIFAASEACSQRYPTKACPAGGSHKGLVDLTVYRIHGPEEPPQLSDRNVGDGLGDMAFVCATGAFEAYRAKHVSAWALRANASWGQYGYCLFRAGRNLCMGGTGRHVGRESAMGLGEGRLQGQCSVNDDVGSWYSLPSAGECAPGAALGVGGCTWGFARQLRTVAASCLLEDRGLAQVCAQERGHAPFLRSAAIFRAALASADPAHGGCPDVGGEAESMLLV